MVNTLTWRDVAAPDFSTALRGFDVAGRNASQGFDTLGQALGNFQTYRQGEAANSVLNAAAGFSDPTALRSAIADGSLFGGIDRSLITPQTLAALNVQPGVLINQATAQEKLNQDKAIDPLLVDNQRNTNQHQVLGNTFDANSLNDRLARIKLDNSQVAATTGLTGAQTSDLTQRTGQNAITFARGTQDYNDQQAAVPLLNTLKTRINTPDDVQTLIASPEFQTLSPGAQQHVLLGAQSILGGGAGSPAGKAIAGAAGTPGTASGRPEDTAFGLVPTSAPLSSQTIGGVLQTQQKEIAPANKGGNTPAGAFQINYATLKDFAPKALGADWEKQTFTLENQEKIAHALFDARKDGDLSQTWSSLPNRGVGGYKDVSWEQMKPLIFNGELGKQAGQDVNQELFNIKQDYNKYNAQVGVASNAITAALGQTNANNINLKYPTTQSDTDTTTGTVVSKMTGKDSTSAYKDLSPARLTQAIEDIKQRVPGTTSATAAAILEAHPEGAGFYARNAPVWLGGHTNIPNEDAIGGELSKLNSGDSAESTKANNAALAIQAQIQKAGQDYNTAALDYGKALHNPSLSPSQIAGYKNKLSTVRAILDAALKNQKADPTLNAQPNNPAAGTTAGAKLPPAQVDTPTTAPATQAITNAAVPVVPAPVPSPFLGGARLAAPGEAAPAATQDQVNAYRAQRRAALSPALNVNGADGLTPPTPVATSTPATKAIQVAATQPSGTDLRAAQDDADAAYAALVAAEKRNDPQKAKYQDAYEAADRALNNLTVQSRRR